MGAELLLGLGLFLGAGALKAAQKIKGKIRRRIGEEVLSVLEGREDS